MLASIKENRGNHLPPRHLAVIMDGNGRWARNHGISRKEGHSAGIKPVISLVERCATIGIEVLTLFAFSSENWRRPREEVLGLMSLFLEALNRQVVELEEKGIRLCFVGDIESLTPVLKKAIQAAEKRTQGNRRMTLVVAVAYGGRWDITRGARLLAEKIVAGKLDPESIDEDLVSASLAMAEFPDVDLLIRTGGEQRLSNFLLWNLAYSELYFSELLWPDFSISELDQALELYASRQRRFGQTSDQVGAISC